ncbi:MAG: hypothetical protein AAGJ87_13745 [Pseudomonadota bacterium]
MIITLNTIYRLSNGGSALITAIDAPDGDTPETMRFGAKLYSPEKDKTGKASVVGNAFFDSDGVCTTEPDLRLTEVL